MYSVLNEKDDNIQRIWAVCNMVQYLPNIQIAFTVKLHSPLLTPIWRLCGDLVVSQTLMRYDWITVGRGECNLTVNTI